MSRAAKKEEVDTSAYLKSKLRPQQEQIKSPTQKLLINISSVDADENDISQHVGKFHIMGTDLYSKTVKFQPLAALNKLIKMTKGVTKEGTDKWNYVNETIYFTSYQEPLYDRKGGLACGKVFGDERKALNKEEAKANNEKAKSFMYLYGLVNFLGTKDWHFVDFRIGGKRIITASEALNSRNIGKGKYMSEFVFDMTLKPVKDTVHPALSITLAEPATITESVISYDNLLNEFIEKSNAGVIASYKKYNSQIVEGDEEGLESIEISEDE